MAIQFEGTRAFFNGVFKAEERRTLVNLATGSKRKDGTYEKSLWLMTFLGEAHKNVDRLQKGDRVVIKGQFTRVPYERDGETKYPAPSGLVFSFEKISPETKASPKSQPEEDDVPDYLKD